MSRSHLTKLRMSNGVWHGRLTGAGDEASVVVTHLGAELPGVILTRTDEGHEVSVPIPAASLSDGVQTFVLTDGQTGQVLTSFAILCGDVLDQDLRVEVDLLRQELELLKRAFRRQFADQ